ncbi:hypothetical protein D3C84_1163020 [compost metagenome]
MGCRFGLETLLLLELRFLLLLLLGQELRIFLLLHVYLHWSLFRCMHSFQFAFCFLLRLLVFLNKPLLQRLAAAAFNPPLAAEIQE